MALLVLLLSAIIAFSSSTTASASDDLLARLTSLEKNFEATKQNLEHEILALKDENSQLREVLKARDPVEDRLQKLEELAKVLSLRTCEEYAK